MNQASDLVGMFINKGPITIIKQNSTDPITIKDFEIGEQYESYTLKSDSIAVSLQHTPLEFKDKEAILKNSKNRILTDKGFQFLKKMNAYYLKNFIHLNYSLRLNLKNIYEHSHQLFEGWEALETSFNELKKTDALSVTNSESTNQIIQFNDEDTEYNKLVLEEISTDFHIKEALNILTDYSNLN